jgi:hypothetical protein
MTQEPTNARSTDVASGGGVPLWKDYPSERGIWAGLPTDTDKSGHAAAREPPVGAHIRAKKYPDRVG